MWVEGEAFKGIANLKEQGMGGGTGGSAYLRTIDPTTRYHSVANSLGRCERRRTLNMQ